MIKQNWVNREVLVLEKGDVRYFLQYLKPEYERRKKAYEKVDKEYHKRANTEPVIVNDEYRKLEKKYFDLRQDFNGFKTRYEYLERFSIQYPWEQ